MPRLLLPLLFAFGLLAASCSKHDDRGDESTLYGNWAKGTGVGDTLQFMRKENKNILRVNNSFNPSLPVYSEMEYSYKNGKLSVALFGAGQPFKTIDSFSWQQQNAAFDILGFQLFLFMSSSVTHFIYTKLP